ncbi:MAG: transcriptional regulator, LysR family [uncultured bacterium]|nr:MAG: transcriptional regulator, LysR family [uncultured bacterium]
MVNVHLPTLTIHQIITPPSSLPSAMQGEIVIATRDNEMVSILPQVINIISKEAPGLTLRIVPLIGDDLSPLEHNKVDFIMTGTDSKSATTLCRSTLYKEDFVCLVSSNNPVTKSFTLEKFVNMKHCMVSITGFGPGFVDTALAQKGLERKISITVPHFLAASYIVASTDLVATLPRKVGQLLSQQKKITLLEPPIKIPSFSIYLYWHIRNQNNPTHKWLRKIIRANS